MTAPKAPRRRSTSPPIHGASEASSVLPEKDYNECAEGAPSLVLHDASEASVAFPKARLMLMLIHHIVVPATVAPKAHCLFTVRAKRKRCPVLRKIKIKVLTVHLSRPFRKIYLC